MIDFDQAAELYLGSTRPAALAQGARHFTTLAKAVRFAVEEAAPVSLKGASLTVGRQELSPQDLRSLYDRPDFPFLRKAA